MKILNHNFKINDLVLWIYYDFANSVAFIVVSFYFPLYLIQDRQGGDFLISISAIASTLLLIFTLPALGQIADKKNLLVKFLKGFTIVAIIVLLVLSLQIYNKSNIYLITFNYFVFLYFYQATIAFYNALINSNSTTLKKETISGFGLAAGQSGNAIGLAIILPLAALVQSKFGTSLRESTLLIPGFAFLLLMIPFFIFYKRNQSTNHVNGENIRVTDPEFMTKMDLKSVLEILKDRNPALFLLSFFFFSDAILTLQIFSSIVLEKVIHLNDKDKTTTFLLGLVFAVLAGLLLNKLLKYITNTRKLMIILIFLSQIVMFLLAVTQDRTLLRIIIILFSMLYGFLFSLSRTFYFDLIPESKKGQYFSIFALFERLASILGPSIWALTLFITSSYQEETRYRLALVSLGILGLIGGFVFTKIKVKV